MQTVLIAQSQKRWLRYKISLQSFLVNYMRFQFSIFGISLIAICALIGATWVQSQTTAIKKISPQEHLDFLTSATRLTPPAEDSSFKPRTEVDRDVQPAGFTSPIQGEPEVASSAGNSVRLIATTDNEKYGNRAIGSVPIESRLAPARFQELLRFNTAAPPSSRRIPDAPRADPGSLDGETLNGFQLPKLPPNKAVDTGASARAEFNPPLTPVISAPATDSDATSRLEESRERNWIDVENIEGEMTSPPSVSNLPVRNSDQLKSVTPMMVVESDASPDLLLQAARNAVRIRDFKAAVERFLLYVKKQPDSAEVRFEFAGVLAQIGRLEAAAAQFEHLRVQSPGNKKYLRGYADLLLRLNQNDRVESILLQLVQVPEQRSRAATELLRVYSSTRRKQAAIKIYEQYLQHQFPANGEDQLKLAQLLNEINLSDQALEVLTSLESANPLNAIVIRELVVAKVRVGDQVATADYVQKLTSIEPENIAIRDSLARQLHNEGFFQTAMMVDQQILTFDPSYRDSLIRTANAHLTMYDPTSAIGTLKSYSGHQDDPDFLAAQGQYHSMLGEHADAFACYQRVLAQDPNHKSRFGLGTAYMRSGQFRRAAAEFSKVQCSCDPCNGTNQEFLSAQLSRARSLAQSGLYCEAVEVVQSVNGSCELANRDQVIDASLDVLSLSKSYTVGIELARNALQQASGRNRRAAQLRAKLGLLMVRDGKYAAGLKEFEVLKQHNSKVTPEQVYGTYRAHKMLGNTSEAHDSLFDHFGLLSSDTFLRVRVSELAMEDCDCCLALEILSHLNRLCKANVMVGNRLGEACLQCTSCEGSGQCAKYFCDVLKSSPSNVQAMLGMARLHSRRGEYQYAEKYFNQALRHTPENIELLRESARMVKQWQGPHAANQLYNRASAISTGDELFDIAQASPERIVELEQDYRSLNAMNNLVATEREAKTLGGWRPLSAIKKFEGLAALEPTNTDALFEIAQAHSGLNRTNCAIGTYQKILAINPCSHESRIALERNLLELRPRLNFFADFRYEQGRGSVLNIQRNTIGTSIEFPLRDEDELIRLGYQKVDYRPGDGANLSADVPFARIQFKPIWPLLTWAELKFNSFNNQLDSRINFDAGFKYRYFENASFRGTALQENVFQNSESIAQNIFRTGIEVGHFWQPSQRFTIDTFYRYWDYSDDNSAHVGGIYTGYLLRPGRRQVSWLTNLYTTFFDEETIIPNPPSLVGAIHPYFSPRSFGILTGGFECKKTFSCNSFKGANLKSVTTFVGGSIDNEGVGYVIGRGEYNNDIANWLTFRAYGEAVGSSVFDLINVGLSVTGRF